MNGLVGGAHAAFSDHSGSGMIELAGFDRSLTEYRNNSTEISGTDGSRLISGVEMHRVVAYGLGRFREGRQLAPFSVVGGVLAASGFLVFSGAFHILTNHSFDFLFWRSFGILLSSPFCPPWV
jgi:hypothetical protein